MIEATTVQHKNYAPESKQSTPSRGTIFDECTTMPEKETIMVKGHGLTLTQVAQVSKHESPVNLDASPETMQRIQASHRYIQEAVKSGAPIYGVTTGFGGMANVVISPDQATALQNNLPRPHKCGAGTSLSRADVRAAMLLRANSLMRGVSGIRYEVIERLASFLNEGVTPAVPRLGSIGASGDLVPLSYIAGCLVGTDESFTVDFKGESISAIKALRHLGYARLTLQPKEGLALINGTSVMTGMAANRLDDAKWLLALTMGCHALSIQGLAGTNQSFHPFVHRQKPHPGQCWAAAHMLEWLSGSTLSRDELDGSHEHRTNDLIQDRYSLRCLAQYLGPIVDGIATLCQQIEVESNSTTDNPLVDAENNASYHCANFLGQYVGVGMDQLRYHIGMMAKHLDVQIALLVAPEFNNGLPASLVGNTKRTINLGLKGLQLTGNSIMPLLSFYGNSLADRFPTHAEQFNQNVNSQGFGSAYLAEQSIELFQQYMAVSLIFGVQAADLRTFNVAGHYDARQTLSPASRPLYEAIKTITQRPASEKRPFVWDDGDQALDLDIARIAGDLSGAGTILSTVAPIHQSLENLARTGRPA